MRRWPDSTGPAGGAVQAAGAAGAVGGLPGGGGALASPAVTVAAAPPVDDVASDIHQALDSLDVTVTVAGRPPVALASPAESSASGEPASPESTSP